MGPGNKGPWEPYSWPTCKRWLFCRRRTAMCEAPSLEQIHDITGHEVDAKSRWKDSASLKMWGVAEQALRLGCDYMFLQVLSEDPGVSLVSFECQMWLWRHLEESLISCSVLTVSSLQINVSSPWRVSDGKYRCCFFFFLKQTDNQKGTKRQIFPGAKKPAAAGGWNSSNSLKKRGRGLLLQCEMHDNPIPLSCCCFCKTFSSKKNGELAWIKE